MVKIASISSSLILGRPYVIFRLRGNCIVSKLEEEIGAFPRELTHTHTLGYFIVRFTTDLLTFSNFPTLLQAAQIPPPAVIRNDLIIRRY
ncbi:hypothetical protein DMENIID0001_056090 [Sergentomyia squamirostris]